MSEVITNEVPTEDNSLIMLSAESWCAPCRAFAPTYEQAAKEHDGDIKFYKVDIDEQPEVAQAYGVMSVPTVLRVKDGNVEPVTERRPIPFMKYVESL